VAEGVILRGPLLNQLAGGDPRSIEEAKLVVDKILAEPERLPEIVAGLDDPDPVVRMRAAEVAERISAVHADWLAPHTAALLRRMEGGQEKDLRSRLARIAPRLTLGAEERKLCVARLSAWLDDKSRTVQAACLDALCKFAEADASGEARSILEAAAQSDVPAVRARAGRLLKGLPP